MKELSKFKSLWAFVKEDKKLIIIGIITIVITSLFDLTYGYLSGAAVEAITDMNLKLCLMFFGIYFIINLISSNFLYEYGFMLLRKAELNLSQKLSKKIYRKSLDLPAYAYEEKSSGELLNRITQDTEVISNTFNGLLRTIISILGSFILLIYIFFNSIIVGVEIIIIILFIFVVMKKYNPELKKLNQDVKDENDTYTSTVNETMKGIREVKTLGVKDNMFSRIDYLIKNLFNVRTKQLKTETKFEVITSAIRLVLECLTFVICAIELYYGKISLTFFIAMTYYVYRYGWIITNLSQINKDYQRVSVSFNRINEIIDNRLYEDEEYGDLTLNKCQGEITFKHVDFGYKGEENILKDFNIDIVPNKKIAIVGKSGQGKSTLFNLITRIFDPTSGEIILDGINIKQLTEKSLRDNIAIIRQEPFIFKGTFKENFEMLQDNITEDEIRKYTKLAYIDDYIMSLPNKYDTKIGEGGVNLSGGQKQRLAIARGLLRNSKVILFDEATSALDNESQNYIKAAIDSLVKDHTIIIIAHRLSTIIDADIIYLIDEGKVKACGTHQELMASCKEYQDLYEVES